MKKQILALAAIVALGLTSCEKDEKNTTPTKNPKDEKQSLLQKGPWDARYVTTEFTVNGIPLFLEVDTITGVTVVFTGNQVISYENGQPVDTSNYSMISADSLQMDSLKMGIDVLNNSNLKLRTKFELDSAGMPANSGSYITLEFSR